MTADTNQVTTDDRQAWVSARLSLLEAEKEATRQSDIAAQRRRTLPWLRIDKDYEFNGPQGSVGLAELFGPHSQLVVYHFMFDTAWTEGCPICSFWADSLNGTQEHLAARDTAFTCTSAAPVQTLDAYKTRMGWNFQWVSSGASSFDHDMGVSHTPDEVASGELLYNHGTAAPYGTHSPGLSVFAKAEGETFLTYQTYARGVEALNATYSILDLTPAGRNEADYQFPMQWVHRHDQYQH